MEKFYKSEKIEFSEMKYESGTVYVGRDTRPSS